MIGTAIFSERGSSLATKTQRHKEGKIVVKPLSDAEEYIAGGIIDATYSRLESGES
jgi:hypothetical protein